MRNYVPKKKVRGMTESKLYHMDEKGYSVESEVADLLHYVVSKDGKGIWVVAGKTILAIDADQVEAFAQELVEVWNTYKEGVKHD